MKSSTGMTRKSEKKSTYWSERCREIGFTSMFKNKRWWNLLWNAFVWETCCWNLGSNVKIIIKAQQTIAPRRKWWFRLLLEIHWSNMDTETSGKNKQPTSHPSRQLFSYQPRLTDGPCIIPRADTKTGFVSTWLCGSEKDSRSKGCLLRKARVFPRTPQEAWKYSLRCKTWAELEPITQRNAWFVWVSNDRLSMKGSGQSAGHISNP